MSELEFSNPVNLPIPHTPRGTNGVVLYLDFDGVLHHEDVWWHRRRGAYINTPGYRLFEHMHLLEDALMPFPDVRIVLSTSWVRVRHYSKAAKRLSPSLRERVVGATYHTRMQRDAFEALPRGDQILRDVNRRGPKFWAALDDDDAGWPTEIRSNLILCDSRQGISAPGVVDELTHRLRAFHAH